MASSVRLLASRSNLIRTHIRNSGFGRKMDHTQMVIMWPDEDGNIVRSQRFGWGHEEPSPLLNPKRHAFPKDPAATSVRSCQLCNVSCKVETFPYAVVSCSEFYSDGL